MVINRNVLKTGGVFLLVGIPTYFLATRISLHFSSNSLFPISLLLLAGVGGFLGRIFLRRFAGLQRNQLLVAWIIYVLINLAPGLFIHMKSVVLLESFFQAFVLPMATYLTMLTRFGQKSISPVGRPMSESVRRRPEQGSGATTPTAWFGLIVILGLGAAMILFPFAYAANIDAGAIWFAGPCIFFGAVLILFGLWLLFRMIMIVLGFIDKDTPPGPVGRLVVRLVGTVAPRK